MLSYWLSESRKVPRPCVSALLSILLILSAIAGTSRVASGDESPSSLSAQSLANQTDVVKYEAARHKRDAYLATATIKNAD